MNTGKSKGRCFIKWRQNHGLSQPPSPAAALPHPTPPHPEEIFWNPKALTPHIVITSVPPGYLLEIVFLFLEVLLSLPWMSCSQVHSEDPEALTCGETSVFHTTVVLERPPLTNMAVHDWAPESLLGFSVPTCEMGQPEHPFLQEVLSH